MSVTRSGSILSVDFGNVHTRAVLIDLVEGVYQVVAQGTERTTDEFPIGDVSVGLRRVVEQISEQTGRRLLGANGRIITPEQSDRSGVDAFLTTASIGRPLRTVLMGLVPDISIASGLRAIAGTYVQVVETISLDDARTDEDQLNAIVMSRPDLIFMTGGTEDGARDPVLHLARLAALALPLMTTQRPPNVLYAGNSALMGDIRALFDGRAQLFFAPNVRPSLEDEALDAAQLQLALAFDASSMQRGAGFEKVSAQSRLGVMPTAQSYNLIVDYLGQVDDAGVLAVDVGSAVSMLSASYRGQAHTTIRTDLGVGHSAVDLINLLGIDAVRAWIPFNVPHDDLMSYALNKSLRPAGIPETIRELYLEHALLRAAAAELVKSARPLWDSSLSDGVDAPLPPFSRIIGAGAGITGTGRPGAAALLLLDAVAPTGVTSLYADASAVVPALGALAHVSPAAVVQVLDGTGLTRLGTSFSVAGEPRVGRTAMRVKITPAGGGQVITHDVDGGHLWVYPLPVDGRARVEVQAVGRGITIGGRSRLRIEVAGGSAGLIFDARGRPLPLADDARGRRDQLPVWFSEATGDAVHAIDEAWLEPLPVETPAATPTPERKPAKATKVKPERKRGRKGDRNDKNSAAEADPITEQEGDEIDELRNLFS